MNDRNPAQTTPAAAQQTEVVPIPNVLVRASNRFPRTTRILALTGVVAVAGTVAKVASNVVRNKDDLASAADHAGEALSDVASSVSTPDTDN